MTMKKLLFLLMAVSLAFNVSAGRPKAKHVVLFAIDGWGGYSVPKAKNIPNIRKIMDSGCFTLHSRSTLPSSSAINWASMFMGAGTEMHGYTEWNSRTPEIPSFCVNERGIFPTIFSVIREQMPEAETGCLMEWVGIKYLIDSAAVNCVEVLDESQQSLLCERAERYILEKKPDFELAMNADFLQLLFALSRFCNNSPNPRPRGVPRLNSILAFLNEHLADASIQVADIAEKNGMTLKTMERLFRKNTGLPPGAFLASLRLERAAELLRNNSELSVTEVAFHCGFSDSAYFSRAFRKKYAESPREYRKKYAAPAPPPRRKHLESDL